MLIVSGAVHAQDPGVLPTEHQSSGRPEDPVLNLGGVLALDLFLYDERNVRDSEVRFDHAVVRLDGAFQDFDWRVALDLKGIDTRNGYDEMWLAYWPTDRFRLSMGWMEIPLTIENTIQQQDLAFIGYAFPSHLDGRTDLAVRVDGEIDHGLLTYDLAATAGEGWNSLGDKSGGHQLSARATLYPLQSLDSIFNGLFFAAAYSYTTNWQGPLFVANPLRNKLFKVAEFEADSSSFRHFGWGWDAGPVRLAHEFTRGGYTNIETPGGDVSLNDQVTSWSGSLSWMITGEAYDSRPFWLRKFSHREPPGSPLGGGSGGSGAWEVAVRYSNGDIDRDFFLLGFTDFMTSSQEFRSFDAAINWYPVANVKATFQVVRTIADQFPDEFDSHGRDTSFVLQLQYSF